MLVGLTAGRQAGRQSDKILVDSKFTFSLPTPLLGFSRRLTKEQYYHIVSNIFWPVVSVKYCEVCCGGTKKWNAMFIVLIPTVT